MFLIFFELFRANRNSSVFLGFSFVVPAEMVDLLIKVYLANVFGLKIVFLTLVIGENNQFIFQVFGLDNYLP